MIVLPLYRYILMAAVRDRLLLSLLLILGVVSSLSLFFGASSITEQMAFVTTSAASGFRLFGVASLVLFTVNYIRRSFDARDVDYLLSRPLGRVSFIVTHAAAFSTLAIIAAILFGGAIALFQWKVLHGGIWIWWVSLGAEFIIMANVAMFFSLFMKSSTASTIVVFGFYLLSRLMGEILGIISVNRNSRFIDALEGVMEFISVFLPRLDLMAQTKWIVYGAPDNISFGFLAAQCVVFLCVILGATLIDMNRRQF